MKILFIGGSHPRHLYYLNAIAAHFDVAMAVVEMRETMIPAPPAGIAAHDRANWQRHFDNRFAKESQYFGDPQLPAVRTVPVLHDDLNTLATASKIQPMNFDLCLVFGCGMIREPLLSALPVDTYNLHLGLSPRYRGAATLFWPFYHLEPNYAGCTLHRIVHEPDAGAIVHQCRPALARGDTIHDVACKAVIQATNHVIGLLAGLEQGSGWALYHQHATGKNFLASDFQAAHLRTIYDVWDDRIVDAYLDGEIQPKEPKLREQTWQPITTIPM